MLKLIKYEWMKRWKFFLAGLGVFSLVNIDMMNNVIHNNNPTKVSGILLTLLFGMCVALAIDHIRRIYKNIFTEEGQWLFTTPLNGYQILGGKTTAVILECLGVALFVGIVLFIDYKIMGHSLPKIVISSSVPKDIFTDGLMVLCYALLAYISFLLTVYLSMALAKSIFVKVKHGTLLSFIFFIVVTKVLGNLINWVDMSVEWRNHPAISAWLGIIAVIIVLFGLTGYLLDRKINI